MVREDAERNPDHGKKKFNWKRYAEACIRGTEYCSLATVSEKGAVWANPVYFAWDKQWRLYFISQLRTRHVENIAKNSRTAVAIYTTQQARHGHVVGIQLEGKARLLSKRKEVEEAYVCYYGRKYPKTKKDKNGTGAADYIKNDSPWHFFEIVPKHIYYFDTRYFGERRQEVPREVYTSSPHKSRPAGKKQKQ